MAGFTYTRGDVGVQPVIFSVTPNVGPNEGGTRITINGDGFQSPVQVTFEQGVSVLEAQVESVSRTQLVVISPPAVGFGNDLRNQQVDIRVRNQLNGLEVLRTSAFRYGVAFSVFAVDPSSGPFNGGTRVTIFGEGFDEPLVVDFGDVRQQVLSVTGNEILVRTAAIRVGGSCSDVSLPVLVTHLETNQTAQGGNFTYLVEQFAPDITSTTSDLAVAVSGGGDDQRLQLPPASSRSRSTVDPVIVTSVTNTQIVGTFPTIPNSDLDSEACDDNQDNFEGERFVTTPFELVVTDVETGCEDTFSVNVRPNDTSCRNDLAPTPTPTTAPPTPTPTANPDQYAAALGRGIDRLVAGGPRPPAPFPLAGPRLPAGRHRRAETGIRILQRNAQGAPAPAARPAGDLGLRQGGPGRPGRVGPHHFGLSQPHRRHRHLDHHGDRPQGQRFPGEPGDHRLLLDHPRHHAGERDHQRRWRRPRHAQR